MASSTGSPDRFAEIGAGFPDEVVTHSRVRDIDLPDGAGTLALVTLDNGRDHTRPSSFGPNGLLELMQTLESLQQRAHAGEIAAVGITGKPYFLAAGADLSVLGSTASRADALTLGRLGHTALGLLGTLGVPTFCFINGVALGGGLEVALNSTYRTVSADVAAIALPETFLGILPAWGGAYLLPRLIGPERAVDVMIVNAQNNNRVLRGPEAFELGIADALFEPADFLEQSLLWAAAVLNREVTVDRAPVADQRSFDAAVARGKTMLDQKLHGAAPAGYRALELISAARTSDRETAFAAEDEALADLAESPESKACLYAFELAQFRAKKPAGAPDKALAQPVGKVGILGAGLMASQLALLFARRLDVPVLLTDLDQGRVDKGIAYVQSEIDKLLAKGRVSADKANRLRGLVSGTVSKQPFADADFIIEAVFEELDVKKRVFAEIEEVIKPEAVLATNTSSLSVTEMAADLRYPDRVIGFHFFNPVAVLPLLEVVRTKSTNDPTTATALAVAKKLKKNAVLTADAPAFVVNRVLIRFAAAVNQAVDEGTPLEVAEHALDSWGLPMRPFELMQLVGPAIALHVNETLERAFGADRFPISENLRRIVAAGNKGVWSYRSDGERYLSEETAALFEQGDSPATGDQLATRVADALADEIRRMLDEGVVAAAEDIDLCLILGAGWPFHLGGITPFLDRIGASERVTGRKFHPAERTEG
ncbi:3-hydroxyacyl-CoA dehydrogenase NAD-binding domain-containing protein [Saxibacter everestensis]|uniref:3-hydroxyacyl-CoA dehydrogenase NAD-binding domain-containing protein n=1 Tax=Saxibacter everestensis TaxID=2909229 RepID=A0ABY8R078_9MICO|nr:3-hydroxyacyl-CoA dehydrogenase NAD-binding domain-containing protein [Brevibacteriaceae bacterium ZFBP1038]